MFPAQHKLSDSALFKKAIKKGKRAGRSTVVLHFYQPQELITIPGPRCGLIVSKAVGNAVARHRLSRQLRAIIRPYLQSLEPQTILVLRALPAAAHASFEQLDTDVFAVMKKLGQS